VLAHLFLLWLAPRIQEHFLAEVEFAAANREEDPYRLFDIQMVDEVPPPPQRFVETNPDAPENKPDETINFGDRDQQLAQPEPAAEEGDMPSTEGEEDIDNTAIVTGSREEYVPPVPPTPPAVQPPEETESTEEAAEPALAQNPLAGEEVIQGGNPEGFGTNIAERANNTADVDEPVEGIEDPEQASDSGQGVYFRPNPNRPAPRPVLSSAQNRPTFLANRVNGTARMGVIAHNALKTVYGEYLSRLIEIVDQEWNNDIRGKIQRRLGFPLDGSKVQVKFALHKDGKVTILNVEGNAGHLWNGTAVEAIAAPSRYSEGYGAWSDEMVVVLGESTEITFTFHY